MTHPSVKNVFKSCLHSNKNTQLLVVVLKHFGSKPSALMVCKISDLAANNFCKARLVVGCYSPSNGLIPTCSLCNLFFTITKILVSGVYGLAVITRSRTQAPSNSIHDFAIFTTYIFAHFYDFLRLSTATNSLPLVSGTVKRKHKTFSCVIT